MKSHTSTHTHSQDKSSHEGYKPMNHGMKASASKVSRPDMTESPAQAGVANSTFKNKA